MRQKLIELASRITADDAKRILVIIAKWDLDEFRFTEMDLHWLLNQAQKEKED